MGDLKVESKLSRPIHHEVYPPVDPIAPRPEEKIYRKETMESLAREDGKLAEDAISVVGMQQPFAMFAKSYQLRPELESPEQMYEKTLKRAHLELKHLMQRVSDDDDESMNPNNDINFKERQLLQMLIKAVKTQRSNNEENGRVAQDLLLKNHETNQELQKALLTLHDEIISRSKTAVGVEWANAAFTAALVAGGLASVAVVVVSGGSALPAVVLCWTGLAAAGKGSLDITKAWMDYDTGNKMGVAMGIKEERGLNQVKMKACFHESQQSIDYVAQNLEMLREILRSVYEASKNR